MFSNSNIPDEVIRAYLETHYLVYGDRPMTLQVGQRNPTLSDLHKASQVSSSAFITACNPFSQNLDDESNAARMQALRRELDERNFSVIEGSGKHPSNGWPAEASFLVLGITLDEAKALGEEHGQNAIIFCEVDAVPQLILLR